MTLQEKLKFIIQNWEKMSLDELAEKLEVSSATLCSYTKKIRQNGITLARRPSRPRPGRPKQIINWEELKKYVQKRI